MGKRKKIVTIFIVLILSLSCLLGLHVYSNSPAQQAKKQIALGSSFLSDLNYQEAVNAFRQAIKMNSSNEEAWKGMGVTYIAWGKDYIEQEDYDNAITVLQEGITTLQELSDTYDMDVSDSLKQIEDLKTKAEAAREEKIKEEKEREARAKLDQIAEKLQENPGGAPELDESPNDIRDLMKEAGNGDNCIYICPTKNYGFYSFDGPLMLYVGTYVKNKRSGTGYWINLADKIKGNYVKCEWVNDSPNGNFTWYNYVHYIGDERIVSDTHGTVKDGLYDGLFSDDDMHKGSYFDSGKIKVIRILPESELRSNPDSKYVVADISSGGNGLTCVRQDCIDGTFGLDGYGTLH